MEKFGVQRVDPLVRRELFAVSLRKEKKRTILTQRRQKLKLLQSESLERNTSSLGSILAEIEQKGFSQSALSTIRSLILHSQEDSKIKASSKALADWRSLGAKLCQGLNSPNLETDCLSTLELLLQEVEFPYG